MSKQILISKLGKEAANPGDSPFDILCALCEDALVDVFHYALMKQF